jgi:hypothetical protein
MCTCVAEKSSNEESGEPDHETLLIIRPLAVHLVHPLRSQDVASALW